jgi:two-component system cell cycle sensor histidine kinase/response regulator CckA
MEYIGKIRDELEAFEKMYKQSTDRNDENSKNEEDMALERARREITEKRTKISDSRFQLSIIVIIVFGGVVPILGSIILSRYLPDLHWVGIPTHIIFETFGSFAGLLLGVFVLFSQRAKKIPSYYAWISYGLITLGILDGFDASSITGKDTLCIHDISIMIAGFLFSIIWLSDRIDLRKFENKLPIIIVIISIFVGVFTIYSADKIDAFTGESSFSSIGGILFLLAAAFLIKHYNTGHYVEDFLFATFSLMYGWVGIFFTISHQWNADWWFWNFLRLISYLIVTSYMFTTFQRSEERVLEQAALLDNAHDAIEVIDLDNHITYWNKGAERLYGWTEEDIIDKTADGFLCKDEKELSKFAEAKKSVIENGEWSGELCRKTKTGNDVVVESSWSLVRSYNGRPRSILVINTNITDRKRLEAQFLRAQRLESIGTLAGGIAHDLNNVMTPIMLSLEMLKEKFTDTQSQRFITIIERNAQRGTDLIKRVVSFAKGAEGEYKIIGVSDIISEIKRIVRETFPKDIDINVDISGDLWTVSGDATQLGQVLMNLCVNSRDAMQNGGVLNIRASNIIIDDNNRYMNIDAYNGQYVMITISDNGTGIPPDIIDRIFDPFFTTKGHGKGTGLGLSITMSIIKSHKGFIDVDSQVGKGTTFKIFLPMVNVNAQNVDKLKIPNIDTNILTEGTKELILVVDDECSIRDLTSSILEKHGYNVITADDGAEAVMLHSQNRGRIKIIIMDMMMPIMSGQDCIKNIRKIDRDAKIVAVSGAADRDKFAKISDKDIQIFLSKPYTAEKLLKTVQDVLITDDNENNKYTNLINHGVN